MHTASTPLDSVPSRRQAIRPISNVLRSIARCPLCDGTMTRRVKKTRRGSRQYLVCSAARRRGGCQNHPVPYEDVERCLIEWRDEIVDTCLARDSKEIGQRLAGIEHAISL